MVPLLSDGFTGWRVSTQRQAPKRAAASAEGNANADFRFAAGHEVSDHAAQAERGKPNRE
jgi:hypothetical protein